MRSPTRGAILFAVFCLLSLPVPADPGGPVTSLWVFGDSLSDGGNAWVVSSGTIPPSPPYAQCFSNGPVAVERLATRLGVTFNPSASGGSNHALAGAWAGASNILFPGQGIATQVAAFAASPPPFVPSSALFVVWGGAQDLMLSPDPPNVTVQNAIAALAAHIQTLHAAGARNFLVPNVPNLGLTPVAGASGQTGALTALSNAFNAALASALDGLSSLPGIGITRFDTFSFTNGVAANPAAYGFTNVTESCLPICLSPGSYYYWDDVHPTTAAHQLLGDALYEALPSTLGVVGVEIPTLFGLGLGFLAIVVGTAGLKALRT
jgi:phospholipase/lecithinase/hemolysin